MARAEKDETARATKPAARKVGKRETPSGPAVSRAAPTSAVKLTNPTKVLFPRDGITKTDVAEYYASIAHVMLPHLAGRPVGLQRWPNGIDEEAWFQQNAPEKTPDFVRLIDTGPKHGSKRKILVENESTLLWLANLAALTIHQWASHVPASVHVQTEIVRALGQADYTALDLDPGDGTWDHVIQVAEAIRGLLEQLELVSVVKTSGQRGLHILIPFARGPSHVEVTELGRKLATSVAAALPEIATVERMKAKRKGRLYIDFLQNGEGKTVVAPYSLRAKDGAPVSTPVSWSEVTRKLSPDGFTLRDVPERVAKLGDLFAGALATKQVIPLVE